MNYLIIVMGILTLTLARKIRPDLLKFNPRRVITVWALQSIVVAAFSFIPKYLIEDAEAQVRKCSKDDVRTVQIIDRISIPAAISAGLEDAVFVLPALMMPVIPKMIALSISSVIFVYGHMYQGKVAAWAKLPYIPLTAFLASKYGIITTIVAHSLNDLVIVAGMKGFVIPELREKCGL